MTAFIVIAAVMTVGALAWVLPPLLRQRARTAGVESPQSNLAVLRDQVAELDADLANGTIVPEQHASARAELERRVLEEGETEAKIAGGPPMSTRWLAALLGMLIPSTAFMLYLHIGNPDALLAGRAMHGDAAVTPEQMEQMIGRLAARLESNPEDPAGWSLLGRSYYVVGRYPEALAAYARAVKLSDNDAGLYADYADALAMSQDRRIDEQVLVLINQALKINPDHPKALVMAGTAAFERQDYRGAAAYLERLQRQIPADSELARVIAQRVEEARARTETPGSAKAAVTGGDATIKGRVALSPSLAEKAAPSDTVFILARAAEGPRMPLAVVRRQVRDLPVDFALGDEQAMSPEMKLSKFRDVVVVARVSRSGNATPQSGDLEGTTGKVKVGAAGVNLVIDAVVP